MPKSSAIVICTLSTYVRFQNASRTGFAKREEQHVVNGPLPEVVVDPEDVALDESAEQDPIQLARRGEVLPERLLDDDAGAVRAPRLRQLLDDRSEQRRRNRQVVRGVPAPPSSCRSAANVAGSL